MNQILFNIHVITYSKKIQIKKMIDFIQINSNILVKIRQYLTFFNFNQFLHQTLTIFVFFIY